MNIQTLPRRDKVVKKAFVPKLDWLVFADYDQIEMRVLAYYMSKLGDRSMADVLLAQRDLHEESARAALRIDTNRPLTDDERQVGKTLNFSLVYGGGRPTIVRQLDVSYGEATKLLQNFHGRWPGINRLMLGLKEAMDTRGYLKTIAGARLHPPKEHTYINAVVQSSAAECMRTALRQCHSLLNYHQMKSHLVCVVHDELVFDVLNEEKDSLIASLPVWMTNKTIATEVPVTISIEQSSTNWAEKEPI
jgi:DNA polymerase-1